MTNTWEDVAWETETPRREWVVEYYAKVGSETTHHLSVLHGDGMEDVQRMLMQELRATYHEAQEIEVTVLRMEEIETEPNAAMFTGAYTPLSLDGTVDQLNELAVLHDVVLEG
ncbi:MAG: hypothetical protein VW945_08195 [Candidatus Poseidoniales archaeon]